MFSTLSLRLFFVALLCLPAVATRAATVLVVGDSLSAGYGIARELGWVNLLGQRLAQHNPAWQVVNASISGDTTANGRSRLPALLRQHEPKVLVLELGANDGLRGQPIPAMRDNLTAMIALAQKSGARVLLVGMRIPPNYGEDYTNAFEHAYVEVAQTRKVALVPFLLQGFAEKRELFQADTVHPTAAAQNMMLDNVWTGLKPLLKP